MHVFGTVQYVSATRRIISTTHTTTVSSIFRRRTLSPSSSKVIRTTYLLRILPKHSLSRIWTGNLLSSGSSYSDDDTSYPDKYTAQRNSYNDDNELYTETTNNGRKCYRLKRDANLHQVARALHKTNMKMLLYYNDMYKDNTLRAGTFVYVSKKRGKADERYRSYMVKEGDSMHSVAQQFGITLKALYKLNNLPYGTPAEDGMTLFLQ